MEGLWLTFRAAACSCAAIDPALLTAAERLQYQGHLRRKAECEAIRAMVDAGLAIKEIVRRTGRSRKLVRDIVRGGGDDVFRPRVSTLTPHLPRLEAAWSGGCRNGAALWRRLRAEGFGGSLRVVTEWTTRHRRSERAEAAMIRRPPPARGIARLMLARHDRLTREESLIVATAERTVPPLVVARDLVNRFHTMLRNGTAALLPQWIADAKTSVLASFGRGIAADLAAVTAAVSEPWSNGQTEGQITRLKLLRRQMYGRGNLDLLRARLLGASDLVLMHGK